MGASLEAESLAASEQSAQLAERRQWLVGRVNRVRWLNHEIVHVVLGTDAHRNGHIYDEDDGRDALALVNELVSDREGFLILTDITGVRNTTASVRRLPSHPKTQRLALLVDVPVSRMLGNAYMGITKPKHATKLFTDADKAIAWLSQSVDSGS